ncbi:GNAT family N-acetyltransferase [Tessaracoccus antarcticus]|uniref:GNAT family N-acetyltransferase n=2 Tax=Tessaracoccus antarcticus TaxID=2479848 RepID=A0A3M0GCK8_9ACTN|nr:GNAT family N-acetyltransferase [Tessaracoccus antarcticus]
MSGEDSECMERKKVYVARDLSNLRVVDFPLWKIQTLAQLGDEAFAAKMLVASAGDPFDTSTPESALGDLHELEEEAGAAFDPSQWVLLSDESGEIGVVLPQVSDADPRSGILSYLAVMPARRGHGLGRQLHQFGLQRLKELGAVNYRGSTDAENAAMLAIFRANSCRVDPVHG